MKPKPTEEQIEENLKRVQNGKPLSVPLAYLNGVFKRAFKKRFGTFGDGSQPSEAEKRARHPKPLVFCARCGNKFVRTGKRTNKLCNTCYLSNKTHSTTGGYLYFSLSRKCKQCGEIFTTRKATQKYCDRHKSWSNYQPKYSIKSNTEEKMGFEIVEKFGRGASGIGSDEISVRKGHITFGDALSNQLAVGSYVEIYLDRDTNRVGLKPSKEEDKGFSVREGNKSNRKWISYKLGMIVPTGRYKVRVEDGMFVFDVLNIVAKKGLTPAE